jgi:hypothetical protein
MIININKEDICNLSRLPVKMEENPCHLTALQLWRWGSNPTTRLKDCLSCEETLLFQHYMSYNPKSLYDMYGVVEKLKSYSVKTPFLPWIHSYPASSHSDIAFIYRDLPFIERQCKMIASLVSSFLKNGYRPEDFGRRENKNEDWPWPIDWRTKGHIAGYFLSSKDKKKFYVTAGNHRAAVFSALFSNQKIPVVYEKKEFMKPQYAAQKRVFLEEYSLEEVNEWPSVKSGFLSGKEATMITEVYLNG